MSIYTDLKSAGVQLEHRESDLYALDCEQARRILRHCQRRPSISASYDEHGRLWYLVPMAWDPFWQGKLVPVRARGTQVPA